MEGSDYWPSFFRPTDGELFYHIQPPHVNGNARALVLSQKLVQEDMHPGESRGMSACYIRRPEDEAGALAGTNTNRARYRLTVRRIDVINLEAQRGGEPQR